ncbi:MAG: hypothetical protein QXN93_03120 [Methanomassiliicoccales archaeon]
MTRSSLFSVISIFAVTAILFVTIFPAMSGVSEALIIDMPNVIFQDDFEDNKLDSWEVGDNNPLSGYDFWGTSQYRAYNGDTSVWCAQNGTYGILYLPNSVLHKYDQNMSAFMRLYVGDLRGYESVNLIFYYWAQTGTINLNDFFEVTCWTGTTWIRVFMQPQPISSGWEQANIEIPVQTQYIQFNFISDSIVGLGPYEGVYIDQVVLLGIDKNPPSSCVGELQPFYRSNIIPVFIYANDIGGSGVKYCKLYYRFNESSSYTLYVTEETPSGLWETNVIFFDTNLACGEGVYDFYSVAIDFCLQEEAAPEEPDARTVVDHSKPLVLAEIAEEKNEYGWYRSEVTIDLAVIDEISVGGTIFYRLDSEEWSEYESNITITSSGEHELLYFGTDRAGNLGMTKREIIKIDSEAPAFIETSCSVDKEERAVSLNWSSVDSISGVHHFELIIDDDSLYYNSTTASAFVDWLGTGHHELTIRAVDYAGNQVEKYYEFTFPEKGEQLVFAGLSATVWAIIIIALIALTVIGFTMTMKWRKRNK